jgi:hypothetical protein
MFFYFYSSSPAIIKINGIYKGKIDNCFKPFYLDLSNPPFVEICFFSIKCAPLVFMLDSAFLSCPPPSVVITDLKGGYAINIYNEDNSLPFAIINQQKFSYAVATVFMDNGLKLSIETPTDFFAKTFSFSCENAQILPFNLNDKQFLAINFIAEENILCCYLIENKIIEVYSKKGVEFCLDNGFTTTEKFYDIAKHKITCSWQFICEKFVATDTKIETDKDFCLENLSSHVLPYAFLEEFMVNKKAYELLSDTVKEKAEFLNEYLGEYIGVFPPPDFRKFDEIGLLYKNGQNKYRAEYFTFELQNREICNIKRSDV